MVVVIVMKKMKVAANWCNWYLRKVSICSSLLWNILSEFVANWQFSSFRRDRYRSKYYYGARAKNGRQILNTTNSPLDWVTSGDYNENGSGIFWEPPSRPDSAPIDSGSLSAESFAKLLITRYPAKSHRGCGPINIIRDVFYIAQWEETSRGVTVKEACDWFFNILGKDSRTGAPYKYRHADNNAVFRVSRRPK